MDNVSILNLEELLSQTSQVLILVIMDNVRIPTRLITVTLKYNVLILVIMDNVRIQLTRAKMRERNGSLNPCYNG